MINYVRFVLLTEAANETTNENKNRYQLPTANHAISICQFCCYFLFSSSYFWFNNLPTVCMCFKEVEDLEGPYEQICSTVFSMTTVTAGM